MKRFFLKAIALCLILSITAVPVFAEALTPSERINMLYTGLGDANLDGNVNTDDARLVLRIAAGLDVPANANAIKKSDFDGDGKLTTNDARAILRVCVGLQQRISNADIIAYFTEVANKVKTEKPGLDRKITEVCPSIKTTMSGTEVVDWEMSEMKTYFDEKIAELESYRKLWKLVLSDEKIAELDAYIAQWNEQKEQIDAAYEPKIEEFHVNPGNSHNAAFTVRGKTWACRADAADIKSASIVMDGSTYKIEINYGDFFYTTLPTDITTLPYGKIFDLPTTSTLTKPSKTDFRFNDLTTKSGKVVCTVDAATNTIISVTYFFQYIWDYTVIGAESENNLVYTVNRTTEYTMTPPVAE